MNIFGLQINELNFLIFAPMLSGLVLLLLPGDKRLARWAALTLSVVIGIFAFQVFARYHGNMGGFQMEQQTPWFSLLGSSWHVGVDGISATMVLLTGIL